MNYEDLNIMGAIRIKPTRPLPEMASMIGDALGGLKFEEDPAGTCDEFPSWSTEAVGISFILLGIPEIAEQVSEEPITYFTLQIESSFRSPQARVSCDASSHFANLIKSRAAIELV